MEDTPKKYKYLVVSGCSQTSGQNCNMDLIWSVKLAKQLNLKLINLAAPSTGWHHVETSIISFIDNNKDIVDECFFILQKSMLDRRANHQETAIVRSDIWEKYNIKFLSKSAISSLGYINWEKFGNKSKKPDWWNYPDTSRHGGWEDASQVEAEIHMIPEHRHYPNTRNHWKLCETPEGDIFDIFPPYIYEQFESLMLYWGTHISSFHHLLKSKNIDHIIVDGYSPFLSHKLNFRNYYQDEYEFEFIKRFWSNISMETDESEVMLYDFKNIKASWLFDTIDSKYKIDDVVLWSLYQYHSDNMEINVDGGHAGPIGHDYIKDAILINLIEKKWFNEIHN